MKSWSGRWAGLVAVVLVFSAMGCGSREGDLRVVVKHAQGLVEDSKVTWRGTEVGRVSAVHPVAGQLMIEVELFSAFRGVLRQGAAAKPMNGIFTGFEPILEIYGGDAADAQSLAHGALIPEATELQSLRHGPYLRWAGVAGVLLIVGLLLRGAKRAIVLTLAIACLAGSLWVLKQQWLRHKADLLAPETEARLEELANSTIRSPEAADAWRTIRADVNALALEARQQSYELATSAWVQVDATLKRRASELDAQGNTAAAQELSSLRQKVGSLVSER